MHLGLIGKSLIHSFSKKYFDNKFQNEKLQGFQYELYELNSIDAVRDLVIKEQLDGFNVTIPYKQEILPYLHIIDKAAEEIGAVNCVKIVGDKWMGYNTDYIGLVNSLKPYLNPNIKKALVIGSGGASKAVIYGLSTLNIQSEILSRGDKNQSISYDDIAVMGLNSYDFIIQTTPLGTFPDIEDFPKIPYEMVSNHHICMDLIYNPPLTMFMKKCALNGATILNGEKMLEIQAEESWKIWNEL